MKIQQKTKTQNTNKNKNKQFKCNNVYFIASLLSEMHKIQKCSCGFGLCHYSRYNNKRLHYKDYM